MRALLFVLACMAVTPAVAQTTTPEVARASTALAAIWRPVTGTITGASLTAACQGAREEMEAIESALPAVLTPDSLARVRSFHSLIIVPTQENPAVAFFFPSGEMNWFTPGLGSINVISEPEGFLAVRDAENHDIAIQIGHAGDHAMIRVRPPGTSTFTTFVGCAATTPR